ncbi:MAG: hypothetical protein C0507_24050 [Cyanobacteria bacterium PR.3.49]|nr:hypothetical protein [Cyanobacteria bacterium PR.3.49]
MRTGSGVLQVWNYPERKIWLETSKVLVLFRHCDRATETVVRVSAVFELGFAQVAGPLVRARKQVPHHKNNNCRL